MKQVCKAAVALFLLLVLALQSVPLVGAAGPVAYAEDADTETLQTEDAAISDAAKESDGEKYVEDLSAVDWDNVLSNRICLRRNKDVVPDDYQWTVEDFPELDLEDVFDNGYSIYPILKNGGREHLTDAIEKMALREEFREVKLCHAIEVDPITDQDVQAAVESMETMEQELAAASGRIVPNDPEYVNQAAYLEKIHAPEAWWFSTGSRTIKIGVIDSGIKDIDLGANLGVGRDFYTNSTDPSVTNDDFTLHGTRVAQIIGALGDNGVGTAGICWNIELIPLQVIISDEDDENYGLHCPEAEEDAFQYAEEHHIPIVNCSFGSINNYSETNQWTHTPPEYIQNYSGLIVASAGNDARELYYSDSSYEEVHHTPSCYEADNIIAVGALNADCDGLATNIDWNSETGGSNYGKDCVDIFAPGTDIHFYGLGDIEDDGTSFAAPMVTGAAALLLTCCPFFSPAQLKYAIMEGGTPLNALEGKCVSGKMLNIAGAIDVLNDRTRLKVEETVPSGTYVIGAQQNAFQVLQIDGGSTAAGAGLETYEADGSDGQKFNIVYHDEGTGYYTIQNVKSGLYLEAAQTSIQQNIKTENEEQKWAIIKYPVNVSENRNNTYYIVNKKMFRVMDCMSSSIDNDNPVQLYTWHSDYITNTVNQNQGFVFMREDESPDIREDILLRIRPKKSVNPKAYIANAGDNAELQETGTHLRFVRNASGTYKVVDVSTQKVLTLENGSTSQNANLVFAADINALYQQWQIKDCGDGTVRFISASTGAGMDCASAQTTAGTNMWTYTVNGTDAQRFYLESVTDRVDESLEYEVTMKYFTSAKAVLCSSANKPSAVPYTNGDVLHPFTFEYVEAVGLYVIRDKASGKVLTMASSGDLSFETYTGASTQYWILEKSRSLGTGYALQNADTSRYLKYSYSAGQWTIYADNAGNALGNFHWFYLNVRPFADGEYIIRQKDNPEKVYEADSQLVSGGYALQFQDYTGGSLQGVKAEFDPGRGSYIFKSIYHPTYCIRTLNRNSNTSELCLLRDNGNSNDNYWMLYPQSNGFYTIQEYPARGLWWTLQKDTRKICVDDYTGSAHQQFEFVPVTDEISTGFYHITLSGNSSTALGISENGSASLQETTSAQTFVPVKIYSSYMLVDYASGNALYVDEDGSVRQAAIDSTDPAQLWQIKYQRDENNNLTDRVSLISYLTMDCITASGQSGAVEMLPADGRSEQSFTLKSIASGKYNVMGDIVLSADSSYDAAPQKEPDGSVSEGAPLQRSAWGAEGNRRRTFKLLYDENGFCKIRDAQSSLVLEEVDKNGTPVVVLNQYNSQIKSQKWIVLTHTDGTQTYINAATGHCVTLDGVQASADAFENTAAQKYRFIAKWDVTQDGVIASDDLLVLRRYLAGNADLTPEQEYAADANDDGVATAADSIILSRVLAGNIQVTDEDEAPAAAALNVALSDDIDYEWLLTCSDEEYLTYLLGENYASYCIRYTEIIQ